ncbi:MAG: DUF1579 family protein [Phycisphaerales bacterium]
MPDDPMQEMQQAFRELATPGPEHTLLARRLGAWDLTVRFYQSPGVLGFESKGISRYAWIHDGRALENHVVGDPAGRPFEGRGFSGFDTRQRHYWFFWIDSSSTGVMRGAGKAAADGHGLEWDVESTEPVSRSIKRVRAVERYLSLSEWMSQTFDVGADGREFVRTEFRYLRRMDG